MKIRDKFGEYSESDVLITSQIMEFYTGEPFRENGDKITLEECFKNGGHCYEVAPYFLTSSPPISVRICKNCGHKQHCRVNPDSDWRDV